MSAAVVASGSVVAVSGQVAMDESGVLVGEDDCAAQARQCFANIEVILAKAGASLTDVLSVTTYLSRASDAQAFLAVRKEVFPADPPATTTVVAGLLGPRFLVEIQVLAVVAP